MCSLTILRILKIMTGGTQNSPWVLAPIVIEIYLMTWFCDGDFSIIHVLALM
jgi:hypothetical protein